MSIIFEGVDMPTACCFVDGEHSAFAHFEYCRFYNVCKQRETVKTNYKPSDCPVKALEQEPCEDAISRHEVLDLIADYDLSMGQVVKGIHALPSVTPQEPKTGHWKDIPKYKDIAWQCSECKHFTTMKHNYCPNCGAKMESEDNK